MGSTLLEAQGLNAEGNIVLLWCVYSARLLVRLRRILRNARSELPDCRGAHLSTFPMSIDQYIAGGGGRVGGATRAWPLAVYRARSS